MLRLIVIAVSQCFQFTSNSIHVAICCKRCQVGQILCFLTIVLIVTNSFTIFIKVFVFNISSRLDLIPLALQSGRVSKCTFVSRSTKLAPSLTCLTDCFSSAGMHAAKNSCPVSEYSFFWLTYEIQNINTVLMFSFPNAE